MAHIQICLGKKQGFIFTKGKKKISPHVHQSLISLYFWDANVTARSAYLRPIGFQQVLWEGLTQLLPDEYGHVY